MAGEIVREELLEDEEEIEKDQYLVFTVKTQEFGIQAMRVQEISRVSPTTSVPNAPNYVEGIINLRGRLATLINFRKKFGYELASYDEDTRIVIVEQEGFPVGIIVDSVVEVIKIAEDTVQSLPETSTTMVSKDYLIGVGTLDKRLIILLDVDKVINKEELQEKVKIEKPVESKVSKVKQEETETAEKKEEKSRAEKHKREKAA